MNLHDDKNLDRLSREAAEQFEPDQELHSWEKLHPRLDAALPQKKERRKRAFIIFFLFLLIGGGLTFFAIWSSRNEGDKSNGELTEKTAEKTGTSKSNTEKQSQPGPSTAVTGKETGKTTGNNNDQAENERISDTKVDVSEPVEINKSQESKPAVKNTNRQPNTSELFGTDNVTSRSQRTTASSGNDKPRNNRNNSTADKNNTPQTNTATITATDQTQKEKKENEQAPPVIDKAVTNPQQTTTTPAKTEDVKSSKEKSQPQPSTAQAAKPNKPKKPTQQLKRWEFGLVYGPDVSTIRFTHTQKPGTNVGLNIGYNFSKRFSVQTGALYTMKNYKAYGKDYHPPKGYWTDYVDLKTVTANCNMWDIPLNLRYNLVPKKLSNVFVSAGLSSYLMQKEDYDYYYYYNGNPINRSRSYETNSEHWFSVLNLSVGYERQVRKNFSVQAEPFFKQSLKGVGFGNVKLNTTGIFLSVKYKPGK
jgi:hypothetical protein